jgi:hypothetical protein
LDRISLCPPSGVIVAEVALLPSILRIAPGIFPCQPGLLGRTRRCLFWIPLLLIFSAAGCQTAPGLSLEEVRKISATERSDLSPPPRTGLPKVDFLPEYLDAFTRNTCEAYPVVTR